MNYSLKENLKTVKPKRWHGQKSLLPKKRVKASRTIPVGAALLGCAGLILTLVYAAALIRKIPYDEILRNYFSQNYGIAIQFKELSGLLKEGKATLKITDVSTVKTGHPAWRLDAKTGTASLQLISSLLNRKLALDTVWVEKPQIQMPEGPFWAILTPFLGAPAWVSDERGEAPRHLKLEDSRLIFHTGPFGKSGPFEIPRFSLQVSQNQLHKTATLLAVAEIPGKNQPLQFSLQQSVDLQKNRSKFYLNSINSNQQPLLEISGTLIGVSDPFSQMHADIQLHSVPVESYAPGNVTDYLSNGLLTVQADAEMEIIEGRPELVSSQGAVDIRNGTFIHFYFIKSVFTSLGMDMTYLSETNPPNSEESSFTFDDFQFIFDADQQKMTLKEIFIKNKNILITGQASFEQRSHEFKADLKFVMLPPLAETLAREYHVMRQFQNQEGRIVIPAQFQGRDIRDYNIVIHRPEFQNLQNQKNFN